MIIWLFRFLKSIIISLVFVTFKFKSLALLQRSRLFGRFYVCLFHPLLILSKKYMVPIRQSTLHILTNFLQYFLHNKKILPASNRTKFKRALVLEGKIFLGWRRKSICFQQSLSSRNFFFSITFLFNKEHCGHLAV